MNNKKRGTKFEKEFCALIAERGYWVHFLSPNPAGQQPFDVIAVKNGRAYAFDCKTCVAKSISISRLEDNQIYAFELWLKCGNTMPIIAVKHDERIYKVMYSELRDKETITLDEMHLWGELTQ